MLGRIVEIADDQRHLHVYRGFLVVQSSEGERQELGRVPLDDIAAVIANAHGLSYSNNLLVELAKRGAPFVLCAANHNAVGMLLAIDGQHEQGRRFDAQIAASAPTHKRLWAQVVRNKLEQQAAALSAIGEEPGPLLRMASQVKSGDPQNLEAQGARYYWVRLMGAEFRRDQNGAGLNAFLNYGYMVLRAATARAVVAAGLHPTIGIHHSNDGNAMRLVDDLMEPYRPVVDLMVWQLNQFKQKELTPAVKRCLVRALYVDLDGADGVTPVLTAVQQLATSVAQVYLKLRDEPELKLPFSPLLLQTIRLTCEEVLGMDHGSAA